MRIGCLRTRGTPAVVTPPASYRDRGIAVVYGSGPLEVRALIEGTPGANSGLEPRHLLMEAKQRSTSGSSQAESEPLAESNARLVLIVEHWGARRKVTVPSAVPVP